MDRYSIQIRQYLVQLLDEIDLIDYDKTMLGVHVNIYARTAEALDKATVKLRDLVELYYARKEYAKSNNVPDQV